METVVAPTYKGYRFPVEVIGHAVWLYHRFALSLRDVEELMLSRGVVVSYESIVRHEVARDEWATRREVRMNE